MNLDTAQSEYREKPACDLRARRYARELINYFGDTMIGPDTLREGLIEIAQGLTDSRDALGGLVKVEIKAS